MESAFILPIPKPNKSIFDINNYRPISLLNTMSKILINTINTRLIWYLETQNLLSSHQFGFRANHSSIDPLTAVHTVICDTLDNKNHLLMVSLDIAKASEFFSRYKNGTFAATYLNLLITF